MSKVESELYHEFACKFDLFEDLDLKVLRQIRSNVKFSNKKILFRKNDELSSIVLITQGYFNV